MQCHDCVYSPNWSYEAVNTMDCTTKYWYILNLYMFMAAKLWYVQSFYNKKHDTDQQCSYFRQHWQPSELLIHIQHRWMITGRLSQTLTAASKTKTGDGDWRLRPSRGLDDEMVGAHQYQGAHLNRKLDGSDNPRVLCKKGQSHVPRVLRRLRSFGACRTVKIFLWHWDDICISQPTDQEGQRCPGLPPRFHRGSGGEEDITSLHEAVGALNSFSLYIFLIYE